jgi:hypothetical protein
MPAMIYGLLTLWASSLLARILIGAGLTMVIAVGLDTALDAMLNQAIANISAAPGAALQLGLLGGVGTALSIVGGALITRVTIMAASNVLGVKKT